MALIKCKECGNDVSTEAKACPKCGAKVVVPRATKPASTGAIVIAVLGTIAVVAVVITGREHEQERAAAAANQTPAQKAANAKRDAQLQWAAQGAIELKKAMKDPTAFELTSLLVTKSGFGCYQYRGKNSFGAILPSSAVLTPKGRLLSKDHQESEFRKSWNAECTQPGADEIAPLVKQLGII